VPKQEFVNGKLIVKADYNNPNDFIEVKKREFKGKGKRLGQLTQKEKDKLLIMLCRLHGIELNED